MACDVDLDLVGTTRLLINNGAGSFTAATNHGVNLGFPVIAADLDGDGDPDLVDHASLCLVNFLRQVRAPAAPSVGQNYRLELHANGAPMLAVLGVSLAGGNTPVPGLGRWLLAPAATVTAGAFAVGAAPTTLTWAVPPNFQLLGQQLHYQALVVDPARPLHVSNAVVDVIQ